ncbi:MAG TPA: hypothetical protein VK921_12300 [Anditalea sp.]|nr:hypothetical protein [Anditalea sp.]
MLTFRINAFLVFMIISFAVNGQQISGSLQMDAGFAIGEFRNEVGQLIVPQVSLNGMYAIPKIPIEIGATLGYGIYGTALTKSGNVFAGVDQNSRIRRNNNLVHLGGVLRLVPDFNMGIRPFLEGHLGAVHTYTRSRIRENRLAEPIASGTERYDWAAIYRLGGGVMVPLTSERNTFLELKLLYVNTGEMEYLTKSDAHYSPEGDLSLIVRRSSFTMLQPGISLRYYFD